MILIYLQIFTDSQTIFTLTPVDTISNLQRNISYFYKGT